MKRQNRRLVFKKNSVSDLNDYELNNIQGGSIPLPSISLAIVMIIDNYLNNDEPIEENNDGFGGGGNGGTGAGVNW